MEKQQLILDAKSSVKLADGKKLETVWSNLSFLSDTDTVRVGGGPFPRTLPGVPGLYPTSYKLRREALAGYYEALRGGPLKLRCCIRRVIAAGAAAPDRLKSEASRERVKSYARRIELLPLIVEEVTAMADRNKVKMHVAAYGRMARVLLPHEAEVKRVIGNEVMRSMGHVARRILERAVHENYGVGRLDPANIGFGLAKAVDTGHSTSMSSVNDLGICAIYLMEIPDCQECGLYDCRRCGKSRQLELIDLYEGWSEPVVLVVSRLMDQAEKEKQRLFDCKRMELAKMLIACERHGSRSL